MVLSGHPIEDGVKGVPAEKLSWWKKKYVRNLMAQGQYASMIPYIGWGGKQVTKPLELFWIVFKYLSIFLLNSIFEICLGT